MRERAPHCTMYILGAKYTIHTTLCILEPVRKERELHTAHTIQCIIITIYILKPAGREGKSSATKVKFHTDSQSINNYN